MAVVALLGTELHLAGVDRSGEVNTFTITYTADERDITTFGSKGTKQRAGGHKDARLSLGGFWDPGRGENFTNITNDTNIPTFVVPDPSGTNLEPAEGDHAWWMTAMQVGLQAGGAAGETAPFTLDLANRGLYPCVMGRLVSVTNGAVTAEVQPVTELADAAGTVGLVVAVVVKTNGGAGGNYTLTIDTDDAVGFGSPTTRLSTGNVATTGTEHASFTDLGEFTGEDHVRATVTTDAAITEMLVAVGAYHPVS